ncbi:hypothetical protein [Flavobacterium sp.]|uniref:hypothetical protein n=1 Tax=Flavobacterium sp. TaxID=239 RepID=UPI0031DB4EDA
MNVGKQRAIEFIDKLESTLENVDTNNIVENAFNSYNEKEYLENLIKEARELIKYNEWGIALENTIDNLLEVNYKLDDDLITSAVDALKVSKMFDETILNHLEKMKK